jgi:hypothetical protein
MRSFATRVLLCLTLAVLAMQWSARESQAGWPCGGGFYPGLQYSIYGQDYIPYFSRHPPVYYSYPVPRTYGWSPYAYPPGTLTPELSSVPEPLTVVNPHVERARKSESTSERTAKVEPLRIRNPYVEEALAQADDADASTPVAVEVRKPKVIYPAATN